MHFSHEARALWWRHTQPPTHPPPCSAVGRAKNGRYGTQPTVGRYPADVQQLLSRGTWVGGKPLASEDTGTFRGGITIRHSPQKQAVGWSPLREQSTRERHTKSDGHQRLNHVAQGGRHSGRAGGVEEDTVAGQGR